MGEFDSADVQQLLCREFEETRSPFSVTMLKK